MNDKIVSRRQFIAHSSLGTASLVGLSGVLHSKTAPAYVPSGRPAAAWGLQIGDVEANRATIWSRADRPSTMHVEWSHDQHFRRSRRLPGVPVLSSTDFTARVDLAGLPADEELFVRVVFDAIGHKHAKSTPLVGRFRSAPRKDRDIRFVWGGDTAGQGWGIDLNYGGMTTYEAMRRVNPDFFIHSGDNIYADGSMTPEVTDADGNIIWQNAYLDQVPEKLKVAETLHEFRRAYLYNRYDENIRRFSAEVPQIWQWDDHEIINNWSPSKELDSRYTMVTDINDLVANGRRAFLEYSPQHFGRGDRFGRIYRKVTYGRDLDVFVLDMRTYRAGNSCNLQPQPGPETVFLGADQIRWLKRELRRSRATWKVIASDMPIGLIVGDGTDPVTGCPRGENSSNGDGPVLGREFEIADLLKFIKDESIDNTVWLTADVHYAAAHYYDNSVAQFQDFDPFWEFVSGPLHAGTFGPNALDNTFGPTVIFQKAPPTGQANLPPSAGLQFFGQVDIDAQTKKMTISLKDSAGTAVFSQELEAGVRW